MAATQADAAAEAPAPALQNGTERSGKRASPAAESSAAGGPALGATGETPDYGQYRYEGGEFYAPRPGQPGGKPRAPPPQRFMHGPAVSQAPGQTPTLNSLLQAHRGSAPYPPYEQPPGPGAPYPPGPGWGPARPMPPYNPQPYRNSTPPGGRPAPPAGAGYPYGAPPGPQQQSPAGYPPSPYQQRYPPPGAPPQAARPPYSPHQGYEQRCGSPQPPSGAPHSPGGSQAPAGGHSPGHDSHHPPHHHQGYPPPRPPQPSTPNAHDADSELSGQNSNDSSGGSGGGGAGRATTPHLRPAPSPTGSGGSRSMSPAVGQSVPMPPRPSASQPDGGGATRAPPAPAPAPALQYPPHHPYKPPPHYPPPGAYPPYPPRNHHPYPPYPPYRHAPPQHYLKQHLGHKLAPPDAMPPPTAPDAPHQADNNGPSAPPASVTALVTTGPDGAPLDEGSQQSTLSNASAASGEDSSSTTPKPRKEYASGAAASPAPPHDEYEAAPSAWPRPPSSPVFNSHVQQESFRSKKSDSLSKLYEMDDSPERRGWVERLLAFMEERRTPIAACPTISKQPLDLYRLYLLVRERGGFVEVTKNKTWKDIAGLLGIGASSSAAYTLRKHYTKNLLAYECHFDRGGIDPQPIINQVEASTKKKNSKANSAPSPGTSNSTETFTGGAAPPAGAPMDGYGAQYPGYPPAAAQPQGYQQEYGGYDYAYPHPQNRAGYPYAQHDARGYGSGGEPYRYGGGGGGGAYGARYPGPAPPPAGTPPPPASASQPAYPEYYRPPHPAPPPAGAQPAGPGQPPPPPQSTQPHEQYSGKGQMPPPAAGGQPRRHPDFAKEGGGYATGGGAVAVAGAPPPRPQYPAWPGTPPQPPFPPRAPAQPAAGPAWRPATSQPHQWQPAPYHSQSQPGAWPTSNSTGAPPAPRPPPGTPPRAAPPAPPAAPYLRPDGKPYPAAQQPQTSCVGSAVAGVKRELMFPADTVEATVPIQEKRKRLTRTDVAPVDAWRIMMALKSGLLAETCWALDILNILLFDDTSISYFGLQHMPGLLDLLLEHFQKSLSDVFETPQVEEEPWYAPVLRGDVETETKPVPVPPDPSERVSLLSGENYTLQSRRGRPVNVREDDALFAPDCDDEQIDDTVLESWQFGGDTSFSNHVMPCFQAEFVHIPFTRLMRPPGPMREPPPVDPPCHPDRTELPPVEKACPEPVKSEPREDCDNLESEPMEMETDGAPETERRVELQIRDPAGILKRRRLSDYEDECLARDEPSLNLLTESRDSLAKRCIALSNILRGLTFVPGNEMEFSRSSAFLVLAGKLLLLHHEHAPRAARTKAYERAAREDADIDSCCSSLLSNAAWWWDTLAQLRSDALVCCANIAGAVALGSQPEAVARPLLDGLLHWCVCPAATAEDPPPGAPLSPRRLALEALCKLCVTDANVDLVLATPPRSRLRALCRVLARNLCRHDEPVLREFSVNLLHYLAGAESAAAREVALQAPSVSQLVAFIERAEQMALTVANQHGVAALRDNPDAMGTSLDMLRRAAATLLRLAEHPHNRAALLQHERRLLALVMSQILDQKVAQELAKVLFQIAAPR